jgi:hypothetical protein
LRGNTVAETTITKDLFGRIVVSFPYDPSIVTKIKTIEGRRWHPAEKHWSFPYTNGLLEKILEVFGDKNVKIDPSLRGTVPDFVVSAQSNDLRTTYLYPPHRWGREREGVKKLESGLSPKFSFEDLRRELVSRKYSYTPHFSKSAGYYNVLPCVF